MAQARAEEWRQKVMAAGGAKARFVLRAGTPPAIVRALREEAARFPENAGVEVTVGTSRYDSAPGFGPEVAHRWFMEARRLRRDARAQRAAK